jgi:DNA repair protein RecO
MHTKKTSAIVLSKTLWKESSFLVCFLSAELGVITVIVQGARKSKSPFFSHYEIGNQLEIIVTKKSTTSLYKLTSSTIIGNYHNYPKTYNQLLSIEVVLEIYRQLIFTDDEAPSFYQLLISFLEYIKKAKNNHLYVIWRLLIRLTSELGFPIVDFDGESYMLNDIKSYGQHWCDSSATIVQHQLDKLPYTSQIIEMENITDKSAILVNEFFYNWFEKNLHIKFSRRAIKLYEETLR